MNTRIRYRISTRFSHYVLILLTLALCPIDTTAFGGVLIEHTGSNSPTSEGWDLYSTGNVAGLRQGGSEVTPSGAHSFWKIQDLTLNGVQLYTYDLTDADLSGDWHFEASLRIVNSPISSLISNTIGGTFVGVDDGMSQWAFWLGNDGAGIIGKPRNGFYSYTAFKAFETRDDYHHYEIRFSKNGPSRSDDTADFYIDGTLVFASVGRSGLGTNSVRWVAFGPGSTPGLSDANYELVRFSTAVVPEPATLAGLGLGLALMFLSRRRHGQ